MPLHLRQFWPGSPSKSLQVCVGNQAGLTTTETPAAAAAAATVGRRALFHASFRASACGEWGGMIVSGFVQSRKRPAWGEEGGTGQPRQQRGRVERHAACDYSNIRLRLTLPFVCLYLMRQVEDERPACVLEPVCTNTPKSGRPAAAAAPAAEALTHHVLGVVSIHIGGHYRDCGEQGEGRGRPGWAAAGGGARWRCSPPCTAGLRQLTLRVSHRSTGRDVPDATRPSSRASPCPRILFACLSFALPLDATEG